MAGENLVLTPGRVASFAGKPGPGGYKIYLTTPDGRSWVELGGRGVVGNPLGMEKQPNRGFETEDDAWAFGDRLLVAHPIMAEKPRSVFRLYDYAHTAEFYLTRSRALRVDGVVTGPKHEAVPLFDDSRDVKKYERASRPNQTEFRAAVFTRYGGRCAFCRIASNELLDAAHIIAWTEQGADVAENGLVLCKLHHCALEAGLIRIEPEGLDLHCDEGRNPGDLHVEVVNLRHLPIAPHADALRWLWKRMET